MLKQMGISLAKKSFAFTDLFRLCQGSGELLQFQAFEVRTSVARVANASSDSLKRRREENDLPTESLAAANLKSENLLPFITAGLL
jgi:hypothetical protein